MKSASLMGEGGKSCKGGCKRGSSKGRINGELKALEEMILETKG